MSEDVKYVLEETRLPKRWYNLMADLPSPPPPVLHPGTLKPVGPDDLAPLFPMSLMMQEVSTEREIEIPEPVARRTGNGARARSIGPGVSRRRFRRPRASITTCFQAGVFFVQHEGIVPAPEANHAVRGAIYEAIRCKDEGISRAILFNLCGHGHFDMQAYTDYFADKLTDQNYDERELAMALAGLPSVPESV